MKLVHLSMPLPDLNRSSSLASGIAIRFLTEFPLPFVVARKGAPCAVFADVRLRVCMGVEPVGRLETFLRALRTICRHCFHL